MAKKVLKTSVRQAPATLEVTLSTGEKIECTPEHPFYVAGKGFVEAKDLGIGTSIDTRAGPAVQVANIKRHDKPATVYDFVVEETHTYFVGASNGGVEGHNVCVPETPFEGFDAARVDAFERAGMTNPEDVVFGAEDSTGTVVEFHGPNGAEVVYDGPHADGDPTLGHDLPHVGWQTAGKRTLEGGGIRGNNTYFGPQGPMR